MVMLQPIRIMEFPDPSKIYSAVKQTFLRKKHMRVRPEDIPSLKGCISELCELWYEKNRKGYRVPIETIYKVGAWLKNPIFKFIHHLILWSALKR
jgi:hypothetical protein